MKSKIIFVTLLLFILINLTFACATDSQTIDVKAFNEDIITQNDVESLNLHSESSVDYNLTADNSNEYDTFHDVRITENNRNTDVLGSNKNDLEGTLGASSPDSFSQLAAKIRAGSDYSTVRLTTDYKYNPNTDSGLIDGINFNINHLTIDGQGHTIDGGGQAGVFYIYESSRSLSVDIKNINFINSGKTAILYTGYSRGTIENCNFTNNTGVLGGAIRFSQDSRLINCNFYFNRAEEGGAIYSGPGLFINGSDFVNNTAGSGGALDYDAPISSPYPADVYNSKFINSYAKYGGAVYSGSVLHFTNCELTGNIASEKGGAVFVIFNSWFINSTFKNNTAKIAAAIYDTQPLTLNQSEFIDNHADEDWGVFYVGFETKINQCIFINNTANRDAGVGYIEGNGEVNDCVFINNSAKKKAGTIVFYKVGRITNSNFTNNEAVESAGAFYITDNGFATNCIFTNNHVNGSGGAIHFKKMGVLTSCIFINNAATQNGGALYVEGFGSMNNCSFISNEALGEGGAVLLKSTGDSSNNRFIENKAEIGGAISIYSTLTMSNSKFESNTATTGINNIALREFAQLSMTNSTPEKLGPFRVLNFKITSFINNVYYGSYEKITLDLIAEGPKINNDIVYIILNNKNYTGEVINGSATLIIKDIDGGSYSSYIMDTNENYTKPQLNVEFNVLKKQVSFDVSNLTNITYGETENIVITVDEKITDGNVSILLNNKEYSANIINGTATISISDLDANNYASYLIYNGKNYYAYQKQVQFSVAKRMVSFNVGVDNYTYGEQINITVIITSENQPINEGEVIFTVENVKYVKPVKNGIVKLELPKLNVGNYTSDIYFNGGNNYLNQSTNAAFNIMKMPVSIFAKSENITYLDKEIIRITIMGKDKPITEGLLLFEINNKEYMKIIDNETSTIEFLNLNAGNYTCDVRYVGGNNYIDSTATTRFNVAKKNVHVSTDFSNITYGEVIRVSVNVTSDKGPVNEGNVTIIINKTEYTGKVENGKVLIEIPDLDYGVYMGNIAFNAGDNYIELFNIIYFKVSEKIVDLAVNFTNITYGDVFKVHVNVTSNNHPISVGNVAVLINNMSYIALVKDGFAIVEIPNLNAGSYLANVTFLAGNNYKNVFKPISFEVSRKLAKMKFNYTNITYGEVLRLIVNVTSNNTSVNEGNIIVSFNNENYIAKVEKGSSIVEISGLNAGTYTCNVTFYSGDNYNKTVKTINFIVFKRNTIISAPEKTYIINYGGKYSVTVKQTVGEKITFTFNGKNIGSAITNAQGIATIKLTAKILKKAKTGTKNLKISFNSPNYNPISKTVKIKVNKEKTKITAKKKTFKKAKKIKKYRITLKNSKNKPIKKVKVILKIKKKIFKAKTNAKGNAVFKIKKLTKKGTFKAVVTYKGNAYYNKVTKNVKITVK